MSKLVIVESPAKARTIGKMLGSQYTIKASMGHVRDLPARSFGVDIEHNFMPQYEETRDRSKNLADLKAAAKKASDIYLAPDPDREGEAIAWHLQEILSKCNRKAEFHRVTFHEITKSAISRAFQSPSQLDTDKVDAQQARRVLDRIVGYMVSPLLWGRIEKGVSAGRVQSVALRLVCERERAIQCFKPEEYWNFMAEFQAVPGIFHGKLFKVDGKKVSVPDRQSAQRLEKAVRSALSWQVAGIESVPRLRHAAPPFITSTLQQAASSSLGFSASSTMRIAQSLYEGVDVGTGGPVGLITYMRTDSVTVSREAQEDARRFIAGNYGAEYLPAKPPVYRSKASAQGAHEAIRPTDISLTPEKVKPYLDDRSFKLYALVWRRFVASQIAPAKELRTTVDVEGEGGDARTYVFRSVATVISFPGFLKVYSIREEGAEEEDENQKDAEILKALEKGEDCALKNLLGEQKFTEPPPRYSEAALIKELESNGVGRPSTYATIVNTIQERKYVDKEKGKLIPTDLGFRICDYLVEHLPDLFEVGFTAKMEDELDQVEDGRMQWTEMMRAFYEKFEKWLYNAKTLGAPKELQTSALIAQLETIREWNPPEKSGNRVYDDKKFFHSVKTAFAAGRPLSAPQWDALLRMAAKYRDQLPELMTCAENCGFSQELNATMEEYAARQALIREQQKKREAAAAAAPPQDELADVFSAMKAIPWKTPEKTRRAFDEKKFFESLLDQNSKGRTLSEKQLAALGRIALRYKDQLPGFAHIASILHLEEKAGRNSDPAVPAASPVPMGEADELIRKMKAIVNWNEPKKIRGRVYDDKAFFESLAKQRAAGKVLSEKQLAALKKTAAKYAIA